MRYVKKNKGLTCILTVKIWFPKGWFSCYIIHPQFFSIKLLVKIVKMDWNVPLIYSHIPAWQLHLTGLLQPSCPRFQYWQLGQGQLVASSQFVPHANLVELWRSPEVRVGWGGTTTTPVQCFFFPGNILQNGEFFSNWQKRCFLSFFSRQSSPKKYNYLKNLQIPS
jgi:hypothetical protein